MPSHPADVGWVLPAPSAPPDRLTKLAEAARRSALHGHSRPGRAAPARPDKSTSHETHGQADGERKTEAAMRRKSRILLCFAVLWVLGIAYYFYSGTALSRKVGFTFLDRCFSLSLSRLHGPTRRPCGSFFSPDKAKMERLCFGGAVVSLFFSGCSVSAAAPML